MRILVIEDGPKHMIDAQRFFSGHPEIQVDFASYYGAVLSGPQSLKQYDGVISDIFFPLSHRPPFDNEEPCGAGVMALCYAWNIPCVLNTAGWHHGARYDWICQTQRQLKLPEIVDSGSDYHSEANSKNWPLAFERLQKAMESKAK